MGALHGATCYQDNTAAADAYFSAAAPALTSGSTSYLSYFENSGGTWLLIRKSIAENGNISNLSNVAAPIPSFPECNPAEQYLDGITLGWGIAAATIAAYAIKFLWLAK
jgi:hypothetical protein